MMPITVVTAYIPGPFFEKTLLSLTKSDLVERVVIVSQEPIHLKMDKCRVLVAGPLPSHETLSLILGRNPNEVPSSLSRVRTDFAGAEGPGENVEDGRIHESRPGLLGFL